MFFVPALFLLLGLLGGITAELVKHRGIVHNTVTPQMGWNSWNKFACNISETLIKETADAIVSTGLKDLGYTYLNLDDCWQSDHRDATGRIVEDPTRFPSGIKALSDYVHEKGLKFGIYSSSGFKTCQGYPASLGLEEIDAQTYAEWGVDYLKFDNCYQDHGIPQNRFKQMALALENSGRDIFFSLCEWGRENPAVWASGIGGQSWRISGDIRDSWRSIVTRSEIGASLWRYAGPGLGWNDPDMLEVGNGGCSEAEYRTHFSLWAMLKAPLIIGNDIRTLESTSPILTILSNKEVIAVNQDALGRQGRIVWSDTTEKVKAHGDRIIAVKCASGDANAYEDDPRDQQWSYEADGTIKSTSTGHCLQEQDPLLLSKALEGGVSAHFDFTVGLRAVTAVEDCSTATKWDMGRYVGGSIVSRSSGLCLEVAKMEYIPETQGKRVQTGRCQDTDIADQDKTAFDIREHQSWTMPHNNVLRNLYQRQCMTLDRDPYPGVTAEIWAAPMADGSTTVLLVNKGPLPQELSLTTEVLKLDAGKRYHMRDLWEHKDLTVPLSAKLTHPFFLKSHESVLLKVWEA